MSQTGKRSIGMGVLAALLLLIVALFLPFGAPSAPSMQNSPHTHPATPNIIDGSQTPERIPDGEAYKLLFLSISLTPDKLNDQEAVARRIAFVTQTGVSSDEISQVITIADDFRTQYEALSTAYNEKATADAAKGVVDDPTKFANDLNGLVAMTRLSLQGALSTDDLLKFHSHAMNLKRHIRMAQ
jgi:hypothetical protein